MSDLDKMLLHEISLGIEHVDAIVEIANQYIRYQNIIQHLRKVQREFRFARIELEEAEEKR